MPTTTTPRKRRAKTKKLAAIVRVSAVRGRSGDSFISPELQLDGIRDWIDRHPEYTLPAELVLEELDVSGAKPLTQRPGLARAIELVEAGEADGVIGVRLNRLCRSPEVWGELKRRVNQAGGVVVSASEGGVRGDLPEEELADDLTQSFGKYEVARARHVFKLARRKAIERGVPVFMPPAGYDVGTDGRLVPNRDADAIREAFLLRAGGASFSAIGRFLDERNVQTRAGRPRHSRGWSRPGVTRLLANRTYLGELASAGVVNTRAHDAIIDESIFLAAQRPAPNLNGRESRYGFWLSKVTRCAGCGGALVGSHVKPRNKAFPFYRCTTPGCTERASISAAKLEGYVKNELELVAGTLEEVDDRPLDDGLDELVLEEQRLAREVDAWRRLPIADLDPVFYAEGLRERLEPLEAARVQVGRVQAARAADQPGVQILSTVLWEDWDDFSAEEKRTVARGALARVEVAKGSIKVPIGERVTLSLAV